MNSCLSAIAVEKVRDKSLRHDILSHEVTRFTAIDFSAEEPSKVRRYEIRFSLAL